MIEGLTSSASVLSIVVFACILSLTALVFCYRKIISLSSRIDRLEKDLRVANGSMIAMGQQIVAFEKNLTHSKNTPPINTIITETTDKASKDSNQHVADYTQFETSFSNSNLIDKLKQNVDNKIISKRASEENEDGFQQSKSEVTRSEDDSIYELAKSSLSKGVSVSDVAKECGLSFAEVSLINSLTQSSLSSQ